MEDVIERQAHHGKQFHHKLKPYVVLQYLLKNTDEHHVASALDIVAYFQECGIEAERRSIYKDIKEINYVALMLEENCMIDEAYEMVEEDGDDENKLIIYDRHRKGFYARLRDFELDDIRLLVECVYSAKFVNDGQTKRLAKVVSSFVSDPQAELIQHSVLSTDRIKTNNKQVLNNISLINKAMSRKWEGVTHKLEKIRFKHLKHSISDMSQQVEHHKGESYTVNSFLLMINDGNYYLLTIDKCTKKQRTYRVDHMKDVQLTGISREGDDDFKKIDVKTTHSAYSPCLEANLPTSLFVVLRSCLTRWSNALAQEKCSTPKRRMDILRFLQKSKSATNFLVGSLASASE